MSSDNTTRQIYRIVNFVTGKVYVGQTRDKHERRLSHFAMLRSGIHANKHLQRAFNNEGEHCFYFEVLESSIPPELVDEREQWWINHFDSQRNGYNMTPGGNSSSGRGKPVILSGVWYPSITEAARSYADRLGVSVEHAARLLRSRLKKQEKGEKS